MTLQPMATAPKVEWPDQLLAVVEFEEAGIVDRIWKLIRWSPAWDGQPAAWVDARNNDCTPVGWLSVHLHREVSPLKADPPLEFELVIDTDDDALLVTTKEAPLSHLVARVTAETLQECREKLRRFVRDLEVRSQPGKDSHAQELRQHLQEFLACEEPESFARGGNRAVVCKACPGADFRL